MWMWMCVFLRMVCVYGCVCKVGRCEERVKKKEEDGGGRRTRRSRGCTQNEYPHIGERWVNFRNEQDLSKIIKMS